MTTNADNSNYSSVTLSQITPSPAVLRSCKSIIHVGSFFASRLQLFPTYDLGHMTGSSWL